TNARFCDELCAPAGRGAGGRRRGVRARTKGESLMTKYSSARCMTDMSHPAAQAFRILHAGFTVAPILFGLDKFFNFMVDWTKYLAPWIPNTLGISAQTFMYGVGAIEIVAGL